MSCGRRGCWRAIHARTHRHVRHRRLGKVEHRVNIDLEGVLPFMVGDVRDGLEARLMCGVIDQDVDAAQF